MGAEKIPVSLRQVGSRNATTWDAKEKSKHVAIGALTAACIVSAAPLDGAMAQSGDRPLPALTVEAPANVKKKKPRTVRRASPAQASPASSESAGNSQSSSTSTAPADANPYAVPGAPYNAQRSASTKLTEPLVNTARTISIIPKEVIADKGATSLRELVRTTPGLTLGTGEGGNAFGDRIFIRGFDARNDMYIDGVRESGVTTRETFMAEQVEIVKGPSGSISGRGTAGGAINVVTKKPTAKNFTNIEVVGGTDNTKRVTGDVNYNLTKDFAVRLNGMYQEADVAGRESVFDNRYGGAIAAQWKPTDTFKLNLDYYHLSLDQMPDWGVPFDPRTRKPFTESGLNRNNFYGIPQRDFQKNKQDLGTLALEMKLAPDVVLNSKFRYGVTITDYVAAKPGTPNLTNVNPALWFVAATPASRYQRNEMLANQTDLTAKFDFMSAKHTLVTGAEISQENISQQSYTGLTVECFPNCTGGGTGINVNLWNPNTGIIASTSTPTLTGRPTVTVVDTRAAYILDTINWYDRLILNFGGRVDNSEVSRTPWAAASYGRQDTMFNWNAGIVYKPLPIASIYAAYATSSTPVGSELDASGDDYGGLTTANIVFAPEKNTSAEVGTKWELFNKQLLLTAALFQTEKDNARETIGAGATARLQDSAAYRVRGVEFGATGNITDRWSVFAGLVLMKSKVTESAIATSLGQPLANIAHESFNVLTKYKVTDKFTFGGQATYKGKILGGTLAAVNYSAGTVNVSGVNVATPAGYNTLPSSWRFDLMAEYEITKNFTAKAQLLNVFDKVIYDAFYRSPTPYVYIAPGRVAYFTLKAKF